MNIIFLIKENYLVEVGRSMVNCEWSIKSITSWNNDDSYFHSSPRIKNFK